MDDVIKLVAPTYTTNDYGVRVPTETKTEVLANVRSVTRAEFFDGGRSGLNPQLQFNVFKGNYDEQPIIEYNGKRYAVYRVYFDDSSDYLELYAERKGGTNGTTEESSSD